MNTEILFKCLIESIIESQSVACRSELDSKALVSSDNHTDGWDALCINLSTVSVRWNGLAPSARVPAPRGIACQREEQVIYCYPAVQETQALYALMWKYFCEWCVRQGEICINAKICGSYFCLNHILVG